MGLRHGQAFGHGPHLGLLGSIARQVQHAAGLGAHVDTACLQAGNVGPAMERAGAGQPAHAVVVEAGQRAQHAGQIARGGAGRPRRPLDQFHRPAALGEALGDAAAGQAGTDHEGVPGRFRRPGAAFELAAAVDEPAAQHLALAGEARHLLELKAGVAQAVADLAGDRPGGQRGAGRGQAGEQMENPRRP